jgi:hypothetical protein
MSFCDTYFSKEKIHTFLSEGMDGSDLCEHVLAKPSVAYAVFVEHSDMGIHDAHVVCKPCYEQAEQEEQAQLEYCIDCRTSKPHSQCHRWREWDFNPSEGGEDLFVCDDCQKQPKHLKRVARDDQERQESGY